MAFDDLRHWAVRHGVSDQAQRELWEILVPNEHFARGGKDASEAAVQAEARVRSFEFGNALWRNNSGAVTTNDGRHVRFGLGNDSQRVNNSWKSSDLIGITKVRSTAPGQLFGVFTAVECKASGFKGVRAKHEVAQENFHISVRSLGGFAGFAQSREDYERIINHV